MIKSKAKFAIVNLVKKLLVLGAVFGCLFAFSRGIGSSSFVTSAFAEFLENNLQSSTSANSEAPDLPESKSLIFISQAVLISSNGEVLGDMTEKLKYKDGTRLTIEVGQRLEVKFEAILDHTKDITLYAQAVDSNQPASVDVYAVPSKQHVTTLTNITADATYRQLLTNLAEPTDRFILKFHQAIDVDQVIDPAYVFNWQEQQNAGSRYWECIQGSSDLSSLLALGPAAQYGSGYPRMSTDGGSAWVDRTASGSDDWEGCDISTSGIKMVLAAYYGPLKYSLDSGATWPTGSGGGNQYWHTLSSSGAGDKIIAASSYPGYSGSTGYIYTSADSGATWTQRTGAGSRHWSASAYSADGTLMIAGAGMAASGGFEYSSPGYIYTSTDGGASWIERTGAGSKNWNSIAVSADGSDIVAVAANSNIYTSSDTGATWIEQTGSGSRKWRAVAMSEDGTKIAAAVYGGYIYFSTDSGVTWTEQTGGGSRNWNALTLSDDGSKIAAAVYGGYVYTGTYELDDTPPTIAITSISPNPSSGYRYFYGTATGTGAAITSVQFQIDSTSGSWTNCTALDGAFNSLVENFYCSYWAPLSDGEHTVYLRASDTYNNTTSLGNETTSLFTVDITPPAASNFSPAPDSTLASSMTSVSFSLNENGNCYGNLTNLSYGDMYAASDAVNCSGDGSQEITCAFPNLGSNGQKTLYFACSDSLFNYDTTSTTDAVSYTLADSTKPQRSNISPASGSTVTSGSPTITFTTDETASCRTSLTDESYSEMADDADCAAANTTSHSCITPDLGANGSQAVFIACTDPAGNEDSSSTNENLSYIVDDTAISVLSGIYPANNKTITTLTPRIEFTTNEAASCRLSFTDEGYTDMSDDVTCQGDESFSHTCTSPPLGVAYDETRTLYIACTDARTNAASAANNTELTYTLARYGLLYEFLGGPEDGERPVDYYDYKLAVDSNGVLYGTTEYGGLNGWGTIFKLNSDGTSYQILHEFSGGAADGKWPYSSVIVDGSVLYGTASDGGEFGGGIIFKMNTDGSDFTVLHSFSCEDDDGCWSPSTLLQLGTVLYGMTPYGGTLNDGVLYKINTDGTGFALLHDFDRDSGDGAEPYATLVTDGTWLYGMTTEGGSGNVGTIFKIRPDGSDYTRLYHFASGTDDGRTPYGTLLVRDGILYGLTEAAGAQNKGVLFRLNTDGTDYSVMYHFAGGLDSGSWPTGSLTTVGSTLYGLAQAGGVDDDGVLFSINIDGTDFSVHHSFAGVGDGLYPYGSLTLVNGTLFGATMAGGVANEGSLFAYVPPDTSPPVLSNLTPVADSTITESAPTVTFTTDENATCRMSLTDESYADMSDDVVCDGGGTTSHSCTSPDLGEDGAKTLYIACTDASGNEDSVATNEQLNFILGPEAAPPPSPAATPTPSRAVSTEYSPPACSDQWNRESTVSIFAGEYVNPSAIKLTFVPALGADGYTIWYGPDATTQHAASFATSDASGMLSYTINDLYPSNEWHVAITPHKGCVEGKQSGEFIVKWNVVSNVPVLTDNPDSDSEHLPTISAPNAQPTPDGSSLLSPSPILTSQITQAPTASMAPKTAPKATPAPSERSATPFSWLERLIQWAQGLFSS